FSSRRRHTRSDRDWSSDVCSSDLYARGRLQTKVREVLGAEQSARGEDRARSGIWKWRWVLGLATATAIVLLVTLPLSRTPKAPRSEERRVGNECGCRGWRSRAAPA